MYVQARFERNYPRSSSHRKETHIGWCGSICINLTISYMSHNLILKNKNMGTKDVFI